MKNVGIILLAAGSSSRLGKPKQLLKINGVSLLRSSVRVALQLQVSNSVVVLGANEALCIEEIADLEIQTVFNENWQSGMASSLQKGLAFVLHQNPDLEAVLVLLCDQPFVQINLLKEIIQAYQTQKYSIVASDYGENLGVPVLLDKTIFEDLRTLQGDTGARKIIQKNIDKVFGVPFPEGKYDVDTAEDFALVMELTKGG